MRLDRFTGKADSELHIVVVDGTDYTILFDIKDISDFQRNKDKLKKYKVKYFGVSDNRLYVWVEENNKC